MRFTRAALCRRAGPGRARGWPLGYSPPTSVQEQLAVFKAEARLGQTERRWAAMGGRARTSRYFRAWLCGVAAVGCATFISHILVEEIRRRVASK